MYNKYIDYKLIEQVPNKYNICPKDIRNFKVLDWEKLKKYTWFNIAMDSPCWCHLEGFNGGGFYNEGIISVLFFVILTSKDIKRGYKN